MDSNSVCLYIVLIHIDQADSELVVWSIESRHRSWNPSTLQSLRFLQKAKETVYQNYAEFVDYQHRYSPIDCNAGGVVDLSPFESVKMAKAQ